jgi:hypothetical protein
MGKVIGSLYYTHAPVCQTGVDGEGSPAFNHWQLGRSPKLAAHVGSSALLEMQVSNSLRPGGGRLVQTLTMAAMEDWLLPLR